MNDDSESERSEDDVEEKEYNTKEDKEDTTNKEKDIAKKDEDIDIDTTVNEDLTDDDITEFSEKHTIKELREMCKEKKLSIKGKKIDLAKRILESDRITEMIIVE